MLYYVWFIFTTLIVCILLQGYNNDCNNDRIKLRPHQTLRRAANVAPLRAARRLKILFFGGCWLCMEVFIRHVTIPAIVIGHRAMPKKCGAVRDKLFAAFISRHGAAQPGAAQRGAACSVALTMINSTVYLFLRCGVWWCRSLSFMYLKVTYHPLYSMNKFVTNKSKLPQDEAQVFPCLIGYHVTLWEGHMIANHPI